MGRTLVDEVERPDVAALRLKDVLNYDTKQAISFFVGLEILKNEKPCDICGAITMDSSSAGSVPLPPLFPNFSYPIANNLLRGTGQLTWLSPKAGLISCSKPVTATVSFQLKDFCDAGVSDLTSVLRVGFRLAFHAVAASDSNDWIANYVAPMSDSDLGGNNQPSDNKELDLESIEQNMPPGVRQAHNKDPYSLEMELHSLSFLLSIFHKNCVHFIPLSSLHSRISNSGKEELYRYIGSSSLKRRQFIERRSYIFHIAENDVVFLQPPEIYTSVCLLSGFLLCHGGVTSSDALFAFFNQCAAIPNVLKESIQKNRHNFMHFLSRHTFAFAPFPSQFYVAVRRNLPYFDYTTYIKKNFAACVYPRPGIAPAVSNFMAPGSVTRPSNLMNMSTFNGFDGGPGGHGNEGNANGGAPMFGGGPTAQTP
uniref:Lin-66-like winged helix domain-containing protein n=1 Tax=Ditylenchus dipsaci TaxID=166011 RepID=A0A915CNF2_9BILA